MHEFERLIKLFDILTILLLETITLEMNYKSSSLHFKWQASSRITLLVKTADKARKNKQTGNQITEGISHKDF